MHSDTESTTVVYSITRVYCSTTIQNFNNMHACKTICLGNYTECTLYVKHKGRKPSVLYPSGNNLTDSVQYCIAVLM